MCTTQLQCFIIIKTGVEQSSLDSTVLLVSLNIFENITLFKDSKFFIQESLAILTNSELKIFKSFPHTMVGVYINTMKTTYQLTAFISNKLLLDSSKQEKESVN